MQLKVRDRSDSRKKTKFDDCCEENYCIIWIIAIFVGKLPKLVERNTPKKWISDLETVLDYFNTETKEEIVKQCEGKDVTVLFCDYEFSWVDDPKKHIDNQVMGQNIASWLTKNGNHKSLVYAYSWNKID